MEFRRFEISTHTPLAGRDAARFRCMRRKPQFLLTRPLRDVTIAVIVSVRNGTFLLTRPLRDVTTNHIPSSQRTPLFLLTRPLRDVTSHPAYLLILFRFLLTRPLRDVTTAFNTSRSSFAISTHTPLAGRDDKYHEKYKKKYDFYSHAPCGT